MELEDLIARYPLLYHMAETNTWSSIRQHGLLSTSAILDLHRLDGEQRRPYESCHRSEMMPVENEGYPTMVLRDQKPMAENRLRQALPGEISPSRWYEFLNRKVFLWATETRLITLLSARHYRGIHHDVLTIDGSRFFRDFHGVIMLCHMNSGNTFPIPHSRDFSIFRPISEYPTKANGMPLKEVAEVTVEYGIPNIRDYVIKVRDMRGKDEVGVLYEA